MLTAESGVLCALDARASGHGCPRCELTALPMPALQETDTRAVNSPYLRCPRFQTRMPALCMHSTCDARASTEGYPSFLFTVLATPADRKIGVREFWYSLYYYHLEPTAASGVRRTTVVLLRVCANVCQRCNYQLEATAESGVACTVVLLPA